MDVLETEFSSSLNEVVHELVSLFHLLVGQVAEVLAEARVTYIIPAKVVCLKPNLTLKYSGYIMSLKFFTY